MFNTRFTHSMKQAIMQKIQEPSDMVTYLKKYSYEINLYRGLFEDERPRLKVGLFANKKVDFGEPKCYIFLCGN
jgi:hypothetical protein